MNTNITDDLYLRGTHSAKINRIRNIFADERKINTISHNRISKDLNNNDNDLTPSRSDVYSNTTSIDNTWISPLRNIKNKINNYKRKNLVFDEQNESINNLLYKNESDGKSDNEDDIFDFSRLNVIIYNNLYSKMFLL